MTVVRFFLLYFTSFSNSRLAYDGSGKFEYYTFLHHSQTTITRTVQGSSLNTIRFYIILKPARIITVYMTCLNTIRFYIILKQAIINRLNSFSFEYYTFLHHSQTINPCPTVALSLNTIRFYIILKRNTFIIFGKIV